MSKPKRSGRPPVYDNALKIAVAREYLSSDMGYERLAARYSLPSSTTVRLFVTWYRKHYGSDEASATLTAPGTTADGPALPLPGTTLALQKELEEAQLKIAALQTLIEIASKQTGIDILKKRGARQ